MIFFGSVGTIFGMTFLATSQLSSFVGGIPIISDYASWITYLIGMAVMTVVLASFYKFFPRKMEGGARGRIYHNADADAKQQTVFYIYRIHC